MAKKILFVAMQMSTHAARWISQIMDRGWDIHLFPVNHLPVHPALRQVTVHQPWVVVRPRLLLKKLITSPPSLVSSMSDGGQVPRERAIYPMPMIKRMAPYVSGLWRVRLGESDATAPAVYGPRVLARLIRRLKPDLVHSLEFQHCGYNVLRAKQIIGKGFPPWLATNWGSDIYYYRNFDVHRAQISRLLRNADYYSCECERDVGLARELGFSGRVMPVMPNTGGLDLVNAEHLRKIRRTADRRIVMVKGYQHFAGRALTALDAIECCAEELKSFKIVVFSASPQVVGRVDELRAYLGLDIVLLPHSSHDTMLRMFSRARVYLGVNASDAISTSMLEAMAFGAFPIQTNTACCEEWIEDGSSGFIVPPDDVAVIADRLRRALTDDALVETAAELNWATVCARLDQRILKDKAIRLYEEIFLSLGERGGAADVR